MDEIVRVHSGEFEACVYAPSEPGASCRVRILRSGISISHGWLQRAANSTSRYRFRRMTPNSGGMGIDTYNELERCVGDVMGNLKCA